MTTLHIYPDNYPYVNTTYNIIEVVFCERVAKSARLLQPIQMFIFYKQTLLAFITNSGWYYYLLAGHQSHKIW